MLFEVRFRYIPFSSYMTPLMYIPVEATQVEAETEEEAWRTFLASQKPEYRDYFRKEG